MNKLGLVTLVLAGSTLCHSLSAVGQQKKAAPSAKPKAKPAAKAESGYTKIQAIEYKLVRDVPGKNAELGDLVEFHILLKCDTTVLGDSRKQQAGKPAMMPLQATTNSTDWQQVLTHMSAGDSAIIRVPCDSILKTIPKDNKQPLPAWLKKGNKIMINLAVVSVKTKAEYDKEQLEKSAGLMAEQDKKLQDYFTKNNVKPMKTSTGMYYIIKKEGSGPAIEKGQKVNMNYTGKLLDGTTFDSNVDSNFHHVQPFSFQAGAGQVIPGWDEGVLLLKKGTKATFYIPSPLAYGPRAQGLIPSDSILMFDVEVVDVEAKQ